MACMSHQVWGQACVLSHTAAFGWLLWLSLAVAAAAAAADWGLESAADSPWLSVLGGGQPALKNGDFS